MSEHVQVAGRLLTVNNVAKRLNVHPVTVYRWVDEGRLPAVRLGTGRRAPVRIDEHDLEAWILQSKERHAQTNPRGAVEPNRGSRRPGGSAMKVAAAKAEEIQAAIPTPERDVERAAWEFAEADRAALSSRPNRRRWKGLAKLDDRVDEAQARVQHARRSTVGFASSVSPPAGTFYLATGSARAGSASRSPATRWRPIGS